MRTRRAAALLSIVALGAVGCGGDDTVEVQGDPSRGEELVGVSEAGVFVQEPVEPSCGLCHTLAAAEWEGASAPSLDAIQPGYERVYHAIRRGPGSMPSYDIDEQDLHDIAAYISAAVLAGEEEEEE